MDNKGKHECDCHTHSVTVHRHKDSNNVNLRLALLFIGCLCLSVGCIYLLNSFDASRLEFESLKLEVDQLSSRISDIEKLVHKQTVSVHLSIPVIISYVSGNFVLVYIHILHCCSIDIFRRT